MKIIERKPGLIVVETLWGSRVDVTTVKVVPLSSCSSYVIHRQVAGSSYEEPAGDGDVFDTFEAADAALELSCPRDISESELDRLLAGNPFRHILKNIGGRDEGGKK